MERTRIIHYRYGFNKNYLYKLEPDDCPLDRETCLLCERYPEAPELCLYYSNLEIQEKTDYSVSSGSRGYYDDEYGQVHNIAGDAFFKGLRLPGNTSWWCADDRFSDTDPRAPNT